MAGGTVAGYTVSWADIAPASIGWQLHGLAGDSAGTVPANSFPFNQGFEVFFPLPDDVAPGQYHFGLTIAATEVNINNPNQTLTASADYSVTAHVRKNPKILP